MLRLLVGFIAGVVATFMFFLSGYGDRVSEWARKAETVAQEIQRVEKDTRGARDLARSISQGINAETTQEAIPPVNKSD